MYRRGNPDQKLLQLEDEYQISPNDQLLVQIDGLRQRSGLFPHQDSRLRAADEILGFARIQCLQALDTDYLSWALTSNHVPEELESQITPLISQAREITRSRQWVDMEMRDVLAGQPQGPSYLRFLQQRKIEPIEMGPLPKNTKKSMAPHLMRTGANERLSLAEKFREEIDEQAFIILRHLVQLGIFSFSFLLAYFDGTDTESALGKLQETYEALNSATLAREEIWRAQLDETPDSEWISLMKDRNWYANS